MVVLRQDPLLEKHGLARARVLMRVPVHRHSPAAAGCTHQRLTSTDRIRNSLPPSTRTSELPHAHSGNGSSSAKSEPHDEHSACPGGSTMSSEAEAIDVPSAA